MLKPFDIQVPIPRTIASIEGDGSGGGGGEKPPLSGPPETPPEPAPAEKTFTQADVDRLIGDRLRRDREARAVPVPAPAPPAPPQPKQTPADLVAEVAELKARMAFTDQLSSIPDAHRLTAEQKDAARKLFDPAQPESLARTIALFVRAEESAKPQTTPAAPIAPFVPGAAPNGAPREAAVNALEWTKDDIGVLQARGEFRSKLDQWRASLPGGAGIFRRTMPNK